MAVALSQVYILPPSFPTFLPLSLIPPSPPPFPPALPPSDSGRDGDWGIQTCREEKNGLQGRYNDGTVP